MLHSRLAVTAIALILAGCAAGGRTAPPADPSMVRAAAPKLAGYLADGMIDGKALLGPPPAMDSLRGRADQEAYDTSRVLAGSARWKQAQQEDDLWNGGALRRFSCAIDRDLSERRTPRTLTLLHRMELDVRTVTAPAKSFYNRTRPAIGNDKPICIAREAWLATNGSYPSGHSATGWSWALVLAEAAPQRADQLLAVGRDLGDGRVVCGVHYPSDVEAGRTAAAAMVSRLHAEAAFAGDLAVVKRELTSAPAPTGC